MRLSTNTLLIVCNPFAAPLSAEGRCTALCPADPAEGGARYVGATTKARTVAQPKGMRSPFGTRDKVMVYYDLRPIQVADTSYYRNAIKSGDVLVHAADNYNRAAAIITDPKVIATLRGFAASRLAAFEAEGGDPAQARAEWRKQGLIEWDTARDVPAPPGALPPGDDTLKTAPRGFDTDHPRIGLLRHKSVIFTRQHGFEPVIHTPDLVGVVRADWSELRPFIEWVATYGD